MKVIKRDSSRVVDYDGSKIIKAIEKAMKYGSGVYAEGVAEEIESDIANIIKTTRTLTVFQIEDMVFHKLIERGQKDTAKAYESYRAIQEFKRENNTTDDSIMGLLDFTNEDVMRENSNKNANIISTQRDLIAGEVSKDIAKRKLIPSHLVQAHEKGVIHIHDMDYIMQPMFNCFSGDTEFVTDTGVRKFNDFNSGDTVQVVNKDGVWSNATVNKYGKGKLQTITLRSGRSTKTVRASYNHRWILKDGTVTEDVKVGDNLALLQDLKEEDIDYKMFCLGFLLGDGTDYNQGNSKGIRLRLCGDKVRLKDIFIKEGFTLSSYSDGDDVFLTKATGYEVKKRFKDGKVWKFLNKNQLNSLFLGYYEADGSKDRNQITTTCGILAEMIRDISSVAGYYISSEKEVIRDTNYKKDAKLTRFNFRKNQISCNVWKVHDIDRGDLHDYDLWCVEEELTNSFTLGGGIVTGNCCLPNIEDMLGNGTVINGKMIEKPNSFQVACNVMTQIVAQVASNQYGGQSISSVDKTLAPYVRISYDKYLQKYLDRGMELEVAKKFAKEDTREEVKDGVQTIQYQINTLMTTNGQAPFLTLLLHFEPDFEYAEEASLIQEEILKQRIEGIKNEVGVWVTPAFPKLIYVLDEHNIHEDSDYYYLTKLASECTAKRMYPDYISAKKMREVYEGNVFAPMGCRALLPPYKNKEEEYQFVGRFNFGVQTLNLPNVAMTSGGDMDLFWNIIDDRMELIKEMALVRYNLLKDVESDVSPIHWQDGALARMGKGETIEKYLRGGYSTVTIGYIGIYEMVKYMLGESHTTPEGKELALEVMNFMSDKKDKWTDETGIQFALYGTPSENTAGRLCELDLETFGSIEDITDKGYYTNSYHVDTREEIDAFSKLAFESQFQEISNGGCISYVEIPNMKHNTEAIMDVMKFMYENIMYSEFNTKLDYCHVCSFDGEIIVNDDLEWECPQCHNKNQDNMTVVRRTCGYLGENFWSEGRTKDIKSRVMHL